MKKQILHIIQGIPGSGKSYYARQLLKKDMDAYTIIVNRDSIRSMLGDYWVPTREDLVTDIEIDIIKAGIISGYSVIVDATNLNPKTIKILKVIAIEMDIDIEYHIIKMNVLRAYLQILWRTLKGGRYIPFKVIKGFYNRYKSIIET